MAGGIYEQSEWPDSRWDCVTVCDGCHTVVWGTFWDDYDSAARDAYFARNGWRNYCVPHRDLVDPLERGDVGRFRRFPRHERLA